MSTLILASASPRRKELLEQVGASFCVMPAQGEEKITKESPKEVVMELALQKAQEIAEKIEGEAFILGADTVVSLDGKILGKPKDEKDAVRMLQLLNGNTHSVYTGVAILEKKREGIKIYNFCEETKVTMYPMSREEILAYVETKDSLDKAGAYGIQGRCAVYIEKIQGDYNNVMGLPLARIYQEMKKAGIAVFANS